MRQMDHEGSQQKPTGVPAFVRAVFSEIWNYAAYGGGAVLLTVWGWVTGQVPPAWVFLSVIAIGSLDGGFRTWRKERIDRNERATDVVKLAGEIERLNSELERLNRPRFLAEIREPIIRSEHQQPNRIKIYVQLLVRNQGAESAIGRWSLVVLPPPPATPFIRTEEGLSESQQGSGDNLGGNLLRDHETIGRGGTKEGWLLCEGERHQMGLTETQGAVVEPSFKDVHDNEYHFVSRSGFEKQMEDIRTGKIFP